jgi:hypothetical protein
MDTENEMNSVVRAETVLRLADATTNALLTIAFRPEEIRWQM